MHCIYSKYAICPSSVMKTLLWHKHTRYHQSEIRNHASTILSQLHKIHGNQREGLLHSTGPDLLTMIIGSDISRCPNTPRPACRGYLHKRTQSSLIKGWRKRWFVLRHDCCLYYYRHKRVSHASCVKSALMLKY